MNSESESTRLRTQEQLGGIVVQPGLNPKTAMLVLGAIAAILGLWIIQLQSLSPVGTVSLAAFLGIAFWYKKDWAIYLLIGWLLLLKITSLPVTRGRIQVPLNEFDLLYAFVLLSFVAVCFRFFEINDFVSSFYPEARQAEEAKKIEWRFPRLLRGRWWLLPISVAIAVGFLEVFPLDESSRTALWILPEPARAILLLGCLFMLWFLIRSAVLFATRWTMKADQGDLVCRGEFANQLWREHAGIEKRRAKIKVRNSKGN